VACRRNAVGSLPGYAPVEGQFLVSLFQRLDAIGHGQQFLDVVV
jgi:hypothetical protein